MNPFVEFRSPWPARTGSWCSAAIMLVLSLLAFFVLLPPVLVLPGQAPVSFSLAPLTQELWTIARHADCGDGLDGILALDCRAIAV